MASGYPGTRRRFKPPRPPGRDVGHPGLPGQSVGTQWGVQPPGVGRWAPAPTPPKFIGGSPFSSVTSTLGKVAGRFIRDLLTPGKIPIVFEEDDWLQGPGTTTTPQPGVRPNGWGSTIECNPAVTRAFAGYRYTGSAESIPCNNQPCWTSQAANAGDIPWHATCIAELQVANNPSWTDSVRFFGRPFTGYHGQPVVETLSWPAPGIMFPKPQLREYPGFADPIPDTAPGVDEPYQWPSTLPVPGVEAPLAAPPGVEWWFPAELPFLDPWYQPIGRPGVFPRPMPYRYLPSRQPNPTRLPHRVVGPGGRSETHLPPVPKERPVVYQPDTRTHIERIPPGGTITYTPPKRGTKEVKFIANVPARSVLGRIINEVTEGNDMVECMFKGLPEKVQKKAWTKELVAKARANPKQGRKGSTKPTPQRMFATLFDNVAELSKQQTRSVEVAGQKISYTGTGWEFLVFECLKNQAEDFAFGKAGKAQAKATHKLGQKGLTKRPVGPMTGPAM